MPMRVVPSTKEICLLYSLVLPSGSTFGVRENWITTFIVNSENGIRQIIFTQWSRSGVFSSSNVFSTLSDSRQQLRLVITLEIKLNVRPCFINILTRSVLVIKRVIHVVLLDGLVQNPDDFPIFFLVSILFNSRTIFILN